MVNRAKGIFKGSAARLALVMVMVWGLTPGPAGAIGDASTGAHPVAPPVTLRKTRGWHDIYLTYHRICRQCQMTDLGGERVELASKHGVHGVYPAHEVIGVDYHPWQRKFLEQVAGQTNTDATKVLLPHYFPQKWDSEHAHYAGFYDTP